MNSEKSEGRQIPSSQGIFAYLLHLYARIAIGKPDFPNMRDALATLNTFIAIQAVALIAIFLVTWDFQNLDFRPGTSDVAVHLACTLAIPGALFVGFRVSGTLCMLPGALMGASTVVDVLAIAAYVAELVDSPVQWEFFAAKIALGALCIREFKKQPEEVRSPGYGLRDGKL